MKNWRSLAWVFCALLLNCAAAYADPVINGIIIANPTQLQVNLSESLTQNPSHCLVLDVVHERILHIQQCIRGGVGGGFIVIDLAPPQRLNFDTSYLVTLDGLEFHNSGHVDALSGLVSQASSVTPPPTPSVCVFSRIQQLIHADLDGAGDRDGSNIYFSGQVTHSRGGDFQGTYDTKADLTGRCTFWNRVNLIGPALDLTGGNDPNGDPDSLNFSWMWEMPLSGRGYPRKLGSLRLTQKATLESTQDFAQRDFIYGAELRAILRPLFLSHAAKVRLHFYPRLGTEVGKNLRGIIPAVDGKNIARLKTGISIFLIFDFQAAALQDISFETTYDRRWPLISEVTFTQTDAGFSSVQIGTGPRDYVKETFNLDVTKYLGLTASYEYGSLPPKYTFLDSKFTFGLSLKAAFK